MKNCMQTSMFEPKLIWFFVHRFKRIFKHDDILLTDEDLFQVACISWVKAASSFDPLKGKFSTYLGQFVLNDFRKLQRQIAKNTGCAVSLDDLVKGIEKDIPLVETLIDDNSEFADNSVMSIDLKKALEVLTSREKHILICWAVHKISQAELSEYYGVSQTTMSRWLVIIKRKVKEALKYYEVAN